MTDPMAAPISTPTLEPVPAKPASWAPDPLTMAAARDTGMPGFRIVATAPPASALPPLSPEELERRRRRESRAMMVWRFVVFMTAFTTADMVMDRVNPEFRHGDLPPAEWIPLAVLFMGIAAVILFPLAEGVPRLVRALQARRSAVAPSTGAVLEHAAGRSGGASTDEIVDAVRSGRDRD